MTLSPSAYWWNVPNTTRTRLRIGETPSHRRLHRHPRHGPLPQTRPSPLPRKGSTEKEAKPEAPGDTGHRIHGDVI
ncbi:hypothetical protein G7Z17_g2280 [Cylindrodendrum hubeiense]|uniref:Uncharacterized protein n=1 Tax=Cylindrodendrum hubeiense TaxID=595255 RepID=A0A9P5LL57_9HYPO|nr:hypothetical protein G7Z17_g2280 [Cylindrodendrum hubeiense]